MKQTDTFNITIDQNFKEGRLLSAPEEIEIIGEISELPGGFLHPVYYASSHEDYRHLKIMSKYLEFINLNEIF